jgi:ParB/RepB/Spo0J family partition protein
MHDNNEASMQDDPPHLPHDPQDESRPPTEPGDAELGEVLTAERFTKLGDPARDVSDPITQSLIRSREAILLASRRHLDQHRAEIHQKAQEHRLGPQGEVRSEAITKRVEMISLDEIHDDPKFHNIRLEAKEEDMVFLTESMCREGLKVPIEVISSPTPEPGFYVRAGFRRVDAARRLHWKRIAAIVLPPDTPVVDEYWTNIVENSMRSNLSSYETACAARTMRDKFGVSTRDFAVRAGYSESYIGNLLRSLDKLPPDIVQVWHDRAPIPPSNYFKWAGLLPNEARREVIKYTNQHPKVVKEWRPPSEIHERVHPVRMASPQGLTRMQKLRIAVEQARELDDRERMLCLQTIDFCSGARDDLPGIYDSGKKQHLVKNRADQTAPDNSTETVAPTTGLPKED